MQKAFIRLFELDSDTMLKLYNTLIRKKMPFKPIHDKLVGLYTCGITAYYSPHIGNMRTYINEDVIRRVIQRNGYSVTHIQNVTDVGHLVSDADTGEDKLRLAAEKEHRTMRSIADFYTKMFTDDMESLNILMPSLMPKPSEHIPEIISLIKRIDEKGFLYKAEDGMYFDTAKFKSYGELTGMTLKELLDNLKAGARVDVVKGKKNITDFVVWRFAHGDEKEMIWDSPWGRGFPGWHIECSALSMKYLGEHFDIHTGGVDHIAIHHTNEIAQSEAATGQKFVNYWMHMNFLVVEGQKMSKSLRNIFTVQDILGRGYNPLAFRLFMMSGHYRQILNFTFEGLDNAVKTLNGMYSFLERLGEVKNTAKNLDTNDFKKAITTHKKLFFKALNDDINTPQSLAEMHAVISETNSRKESGKLNKAEARFVAKVMLTFDEVLGLNFAEHVSAKKEPLAAEIKKLVDERETARKSKDFKKADEIRKLLGEKYHIVLEDTKDGVVWHKP